ncbi:putative peptidase C15, pyroglutamyl peptidase I [Lupinus albus]|uniref:Putative peptidase C15, pyroglutamyl peptidase I n=1 Tax=Lupinus albus TaxID=3870 RepID=A0A6A4QZW4_LUPAL|nr:putative peptidase C15, pyroglutamyl peptidase I [Lupinus albus]
MGCECPPAAAAVTTVHVTGFKKFHGVSENPTETIVNNLKVHMNKKGLPKGLVIGSCNILETSGQGALIPLHQTLQSSISAKESEFSSSNKIIWVSCKFECNYVYYHSLRFSEQNWTKSLFVHVPLFFTIDEETQMQFAASLLAS